MSKNEVTDAPLFRMIKPGKITTIALLLLTTISRTALGQERVQVSAYGPAHSNGIVVITNNQNFFGLRFLIYRQGATFESSAQQMEFGSHATGGAYSKINW